MRVSRHAVLRYTQRVWGIRKGKAGLTVLSDAKRDIEWQLKSKVRDRRLSVLLHCDCYRLRDSWALVNNDTVMTIMTHKELRRFDEGTVRERLKRSSRGRKRAWKQKIAEQEAGQDD